MVKRMRLVVALSLVAGATSVATAAPAHACFNPDDPMCQINVAFCNATENVAKYRDKVVNCWYS